MKTFGRVAIALAALMMAPALTAGAAEAPKAEGGKKRVVVVWSEGTAPKDVYPKDINGAIAEGLATMKGWEVVTASIGDPDHGLPDELLKRTDVLIWWGHKKHEEVKSELVQKIAARVRDEGMGLISLHSSHFARINKELMGTPCTWGAYKGDASTLKVTVKDAAHPIAKGVKEFTIAHDERYSEPYAVNEPAAVVFDGVHALKDGGQDPSRVGLCWQVGQGRFFYFQAGHETNPVYYDKNVQKIMRNAVRWAAPKKGNRKAKA